MSLGGKGERDDHSHCNPGEAYMLLITASCETGPASMHMCTFEIFIWRILILEFADRCYFKNSTFDLSKLHLYFKFVNI
jgi:hypothetical protein